MAKQPQNQEPAEVVIFYARARGGGAVVAESVRALAEAVEHAAQPKITARVVKSFAAPGAGNGKTAEKTLFDSIEEQVEEQGADEFVADDFDAAATSGGGVDRKPSRDRKPPVYQFVKDLNLRPQDKVSLKDFFAAKAPSDQQEQFVGIVYYLTRTLGLSNVGIDHIYTAMKDIGAKVPNDIAQAARNTAKRKGWIDSSDSTNLRVTTSGENYVEHDLPKGKA